MDKFLVIYDVRGIQKYIFRTNKIREISGASNIVQNKLIELLKRVISNDENIFKTKWEEMDFLFDENEKLLAEIIYIGGGNIVLAYRGDELSLVDINKELQKSFMKETYSLSLAFAYVKMTNSYKDDLRNVKAKLNNVKTRMPQLVMNQGLPIVAYDSLNGLPLSEYTYVGDEKKQVSKEAYLKLKEYKSNGEDELDVIAQKDDRDNDKTMLAIVHIDGNDIGAMISNYYDKTTIENDYSSQVKASREVSKKVNDTFTKSVIDSFNEKQIAYRIVINSGDDITFICKAEYGISITQKIIEKIEENSLSTYNFSACGGICMVHSHFPFYKAYEMAEDLCSNAKKQAKTNLLNNGRPSSYIDFDICQSGIIKPILKTREENKELYLRPYCISKELEEKINDEHISSFIKLTKLLDKNVARNVIKELRNKYQESTNNLNIYYEKIKSRNKLFQKFSPYNQSNVATFYDACSMIDLTDFK